MNADVRDPAEGSRLEEISQEIRDRWQKVGAFLVAWPLIYSPTLVLVRYSVEGFIDKNRDSLFQDFKRLLYNR